MAAPGGLTPLFDIVNVNYELVNRNTLQTITHSGSYAEVNNSQFVFLKVRPELTSFDKRINKILLTFKQYTNLNYQVYLNTAIATHLINNEQIPLRKYTLNGVINKLESILYVERKTTRPSDDYNYGVGNTLDYIWYKLQELKGSEKE